MIVPATFGPYSSEPDESTLRQCRNRIDAAQGWTFVSGPVVEGDEKKGFGVIFMVEGESLGPDDPAWIGTAGLIPKRPLARQLNALPVRRTLPRE